MKQPKPTPNSGDITIGKKPVWQIWAEEEQKKDHEYERLVNLGYVSISVAAKATGWSVEKTRGKLIRQCVDKRPANEPDTGKMVTMYLMPEPAKQAQETN